MSPVALILVAFGIDRLLRSGRPRLLRPVQQWWLEARPRLILWVRSAPLTYGYLAVLFVTTWVLASASARLGNRLLLEQSTNLHQLARDPVRVLISSAFWLPGTATLVAWAALLTVVLAPVERRVGSWRLGIVFGVGHVGATLLTAAGLWTALRLDAVEVNVVNAPDVGASYGFFAVAGALTYLLAPRLRLAYALLLVIPVAGVAAAFHTFTDFGHLLSILIGFACYRLVRGRSVRAPIDVSLPALRGWARTSHRKLA
jgi:hypothetical protein